ncbi:MAG: hypothetical protein RNU03_04170 [Candidatus Sedimenticola sp. (ex Thyasira tokunagai)]
MALVVVILLATFMRYGREADQQPQHEVTIALSATPAPGLVFVAHEGGFFSAEGLKVTLQNQSSGKAALGATPATNHPRTKAKKESESCA